MVSMMDTCGAVGPNTWTLTWVLWLPEKHAWMFGMLRECRICRFQLETWAVGPNVNTWTVTWILWWLGMHAWMWGHAEGVQIAISDIKRRTLPARDKYIGRQINVIYLFVQWSYHYLLTIFHGFHHLKTTVEHWPIIITLTLDYAKLWNMQSIC